jgi:hypothetical protein
MSNKEIEFSLGRSPSVSKAEQLLKYGIWLYFLLLIFEGALRKWFLPALSTPLLIVRDPLAVWIIIVALRNNFLKSNLLIVGMVAIGVLSFFTAVFMGHGNGLVAFYGARILLFHFPLMFVIGSVFKREDVLALGKTILYISIPMTLLIALQFYSPQSSWVNRGVGGDMEGAGFGGALGYFRPPGTFSFTNGTTLFYSFVASYIFYFWFQAKEQNKLLVLISTTCLLIAIPLSISRGLFFQVIVTAIFSLFSIMKNPKYLSRMVMACMFFILIFAALSKTSFFQTGTEVFTNRFTNANETEGGIEGVLLDRFLGGMLSGLQSSSRQPFFGYGTGMGTNVGAQLLEGKLTFLIDEQEWARIIGELGPLLGLIVIFIRVVFCLKIFRYGCTKLTVNDSLPWMLISFGLITVAQGQWAQPTALGFSTLIGGLIIASFKEPVKSEEHIIQGES